MVDSVLKLLGAALSIWDSKEKVKYIAQKEQLEKDWYAEYNKDLAERSDAVLDNIRFQLCELSDLVAAQIGASRAQAQS
jgi:hypothetical protein